MSNPRSPEGNQNYFDLFVLLSAGVALALGIGWGLGQFPKFFPGFKISFSQEIILSAIPLVFGLIKWVVDRLVSVRKLVEGNSTKLETLIQKSKEIEETVRRLDKENLWNKVQIENLYSRLEDVEDEEDSSHRRRRADSN